ncbi:Inositol phoshorylceramide synthase regulatory subunit kei1 [Leucoagaricus sp. SymC.cos]|nr:Inositol phoshorylceramide synthase regulatory subunit kei1 [Leucoagaricus sp. SymC.cos]
MKLTLRPEWRLWPLSSFLGLIDLKTGVTIALLFALLNKVAGVYGLIAVLTGAGGSFAQLSLYIYSVIALVALGWGLRAVKDEDPKQTLYFAHLFAADHVLSTAWTVFFTLVWWIWTPHDGRRQANSAAQEAMMKTANITNHLTPEEREAAAMAIWNHEKGTAAAVIVISWITKLYFALLLYSYATHLRKGSYRSLPFSRSSNYTSLSSNLHTQGANSYETALDMADEESGGDFYHVPLRNTHKSLPTSHSNITTISSNSNSTRGHRRTTSASSNITATQHKANGSVSSFADFVSAPGRHPRRSKNNLGSVSGGVGGVRDRGMDIEEEVLFDEDEMTYVSGSSSRAHSKIGTEGSSTAASTDEERGKHGSD